MKYIFDTNALIKLARECIDNIDFSNICVTNIGIKEFEDGRNRIKLSEDEKNKELDRIEKLIEKIKKENILELDYRNIKSIKKVFDNDNIKFDLSKGTGLNDIVLAALSYDSSNLKIVLDGDKKLAKILGDKLLRYDDWRKGHR